LVENSYLNYAPAVTATGEYYTQQRF